MAAKRTYTRTLHFPFILGLYSSNRNLYTLSKICTLKEWKKEQHSRKNCHGEHVICNHSCIHIWKPVCQVSGHCRRSTVQPPSKTCRTGLQAATWRTGRRWMSNRCAACSPSLSTAARAPTEQMTAECDETSGLGDLKGKKEHLIWVDRKSVV